MKDHDNEIISLFVSRSEEAIVKLTEDSKTIEFFESMA